MKALIALPVMCLLASSCSAATLTFSGITNATEFETSVRFLAAPFDLTFVTNATGQDAPITSGSFTIGGETYAIYNPDSNPNYLKATDKMMTWYDLDSQATILNFTSPAFSGYTFDTPLTIGNVTPDIYPDGFPTIVGVGNGRTGGDIGFLFDGMSQVKFSATGQAPEPAACGLFGAGLLGLAAISRRLRVRH